MTIRDLNMELYFILGTEVPLVQYVHFLCILPHTTSFIHGPSVSPPHPYRGLITQISSPSVSQSPVPSLFRSRSFFLLPSTQYHFICGRWGYRQKWTVGPTVLLTLHTDSFPVEEHRRSRGGPRWTDFVFSPSPWQDLFGSPTRSPSPWDPRWETLPWPPRCKRVEVKVGRKRRRVRERRCRDSNVYNWVLTVFPPGSQRYGEGL